MVADALASYVHLGAYLIIRRALRCIVENPDALGASDTAMKVQTLLDTVYCLGAQSELDSLHRNRGVIDSPSDISDN